MSNTSDWTKNPDGHQKETERSLVSKCVQFFALLFLLWCVEVVKENLERPTDLQAVEESQISVKLPTQICPLGLIWVLFYHI